VYEVEISSTSKTLLFLTKGQMVHKNKTTGQVVKEYFPGDSASEWRDELLEALSAEESVMFCLTGKLNRDYIPETETVVLKANETKTYNAGTKFFLCQGVIHINEVEYTGPCQIGFKNAQTIETNTDVYGLIIK
jgi:hypothetical protein